MKYRDGEEDPVTTPANKNKNKGDAGPDADAPDDERPAGEDGGAMPSDASDTGAADVVLPALDPCVEERTLAGIDVVETRPTDNVTSNEVNAFPYVGRVSAAARCFRVYLANAPAITVRVGVYADGTDAPGSRIAQGTIAAPVVGWNKVTLDAVVSVEPARRLWLALTVASGEIDIVCRRDCEGRRKHTNANGVLPASFVAESTTSYCEAAFYLSP